MTKQRIAIQRQAQLREVGRIRTGERVLTADGKERAAGRDTFKLTSTSRTLLETIGRRLGGDVRPFATKPGEWEICTDRDELPVYVSPVDWSQSYEQWKAGGCTHRCDGVTCTLADATTKPCLCDPRGIGAEMPERDRTCKLTTRVSVMLPDSLDIGLWRIESHGQIFASEVSALLSRFEMLGLGPVGCTLGLQWREIKKPGSVKSRFVVPYLQLDPNPAPLAQLLLNSTLGHQVRQAELPSSRPQLGAGQALTSNAQSGTAQSGAAKPKAAAQLPPLPPGFTMTHADAERVAREHAQALKWSGPDLKPFVAAAKEAGYHWPAMLVLAIDAREASDVEDAVAFVGGYAQALAEAEAFTLGQAAEAAEIEALYESSSPEVEPTSEESPPWLSEGGVIEAELVEEPANV